MKYKLFIKRYVRKVIQKEVESREEALKFLETVPFAYVEYTYLNTYTTKEELENVKSIRPSAGTKLDYEFTDDGQILENTDSELPGADPDNSESSPECDN